MDEFKKELFFWLKFILKLAAGFYGVYLFLDLCRSCGPGNGFLVALIGSLLVFFLAARNK